MNKAVFTGRLTREPELKRTNAGTAVLSASIAVDDGWGEKKRTFFPDLVFWRHNAEYVGKYARKGDLLEVVARYSERRYQDRDGHNRVAREFEVEDVKILSNRRSEGQDAAQSAYGGEVAPGDFAEITDTDDGELPF